jgi:ketosteroid isomerase-like protein
VKGYIFFILSLVYSFVGFTQTDSDKLKTEINSTINSWHLAASKADYNAYFKLMDADAVFIGTDASEVWTKTEFEKFSKPHFDKGKAWDFKAIDRIIYFSDDFKYAWFTEKLDTWMGICRCTGVVKKTSEGWLIKHYQLSVAVPNDKIKEVISIIKPEKSKQDRNE